MRVLNEDELECIVGGAELITGLLSPNGTNIVQAPPAAIGGALTAFSQVSGNTPPSGGAFKNLLLVL